MEQEGSRVVLNVYDLSQGLARQLSSTFLGKAIEGIWHTGIVVYGYEYYYGGGIQSSLDGQTPYGKPIKVMELGYTEVPKEVLEDFLQDISPRYTEQTYSLLRHNCNNFSNEVAEFLCGVGIPEFIIKLPEEVMSSPMGALIMPMIQQFETVLRYGGVPQVPRVGASGLPAVAPVLATNVSQKVSPLGNESAMSAITASTSALAAPSETKLEKSDSDANCTSVPDKLGEARMRVQEEITREFVSLMAEGRLRASEAAAIATRRVMERHGRGTGLSSQN